MMLLQDDLLKRFFFGGACIGPELTATVKNQSERPKQFFEDALITSSESKYRTSARIDGEQL